MLANCALRHDVHHREDGCVSVAVNAHDSTRFSSQGLGEGLSTCNTADALRCWLQQFARHPGFYGGRYVHVGHIRFPRQLHSEKPIRHLSTAARETALGEADGWLHRDPVSALASASFAPFTWSTRANAGLSDSQKTWLNQERARGVGAGIALPVQDHAAGPAYLSLFGVDEAKAKRLLDERAPELAFVGAQFHALARSLLPFADGTNARADLTRREVECLRLAAQGWTVPASAAELSITGRTVEFHLGNAAEKLGAANKIHAVAIAASNRLFPI